METTFLIGALTAALAAHFFLPGSESLPLILMITAWLLLGLGVIKENERGVKILLGKPYAVIESGLYWAPFLLAKINRYTTQIVELNFDRAGVFTKSGKIAGEHREYGPANVGIDISFRFRWPTDRDQLIEAVKVLPDPENKAALTSVFEEPILDAVRNIGGEKIWIELTRKRMHFGKSVLDSIMAVAADGSVHEGNLIKLSHITDLTVAVAHVEVPTQLLESLTAQEIASLQKAATIITAEGEKRKRELEGEGAAEAKKRLLEAIGGEDRYIEIQKLLSLEAMAQGPATTIFPIASNLTESLGNILSHSRGMPPQELLNALTAEQRQQLITLLQNQLNPRQGG